MACFPMACLLTACQVASTGPSVSPPSATALSAGATALETCTGATPLVAGVPGSPGHLVPTEINPNGQSELAVLMRLMQADLKRAGAAIEAGTPVQPMGAHRRIRCAWPTTPSDRSPAFDALAQAYLGQVAALESAPATGARAAHGGVLDACRACHEQACPGPLTAIDALRLSAN